MTVFEHIVVPSLAHHNNEARQKSLKLWQVYYQDYPQKAMDQVDQVSDMNQHVKLKIDQYVKANQIVK